MGRWFSVFPGPYISLRYLGLVSLSPVIVSVLKVPISGINKKAISWVFHLRSCVSVFMLPG